MHVRISLDAVFAAQATSSFCPVRSPLRSPSVARGVLEPGQQHRAVF